MHPDLRDLWPDLVAGTKLNHVLRFLDASGVRSRKCVSIQDEVHLADLIRVSQLTHTDSAVGGIALQKWNEPVEIMLVGHGVQSKVERMSKLREVSTISVEDNLLCAESLGVVGLVWGRREHSNVGAQCGR